MSHSNQTSSHHRRRPTAITGSMTVAWLLLVTGSTTFGYVHPPLVSPGLRGATRHTFPVRSSLLNPATTAGGPHSFRAKNRPRRVGRMSTHLGLGNGEEVVDFYMLLAERGVVAAVAGATSMLVSILSYSLLAVAQRRFGLAQGSERRRQDKEDFRAQQTKARNLSILAQGLVISGFLLTVPIVGNVVNRETTYQEKPITSLLSERTPSSMESSTQLPPVAALGSPPRSQTSLLDDLDSVTPTLSSSLLPRPSELPQGTPVVPKPNESQAKPKQSVQLDAAPSLSLPLSGPITEATQSDFAKQILPPVIPKDMQPWKPSSSSPETPEKSETPTRVQPSKPSSDLLEGPLDTTAANPAPSLADTSRTDLQLAAPSSSHSDEGLFYSPPVIRPFKPPSSVSKTDTDGPPRTFEAPGLRSTISDKSDVSKSSPTILKQAELSRKPADTLYTSPTESVPSNRKSPRLDSPVSESPSRIPSPKLSDSFTDAPATTQLWKDPSNSVTSSLSQGTPSAINTSPSPSNLLSGSFGSPTQNLLLGTGVASALVLLLQNYLREIVTAVEKRRDRNTLSSATRGAKDGSGQRNVIESKGLDRIFATTDNKVDSALSIDTLMENQPSEIGLEMENPVADMSQDNKPLPTETTQAMVEVLRESAGVPFLDKEINFAADQPNATTTEAEETDQYSVDYWWEEGISGKNLTQVVLGTKSPALDSFSFPMAMPREIRRQLVLAKYGINNTKSTLRLPVTVRNLTRRRRQVRKSRVQQKQALAEPASNVADSWLDSAEPASVAPPEDMASPPLDEIRKLTKTIDSAIGKDGTYALRKNNSTEILLQTDATEPDIAYQSALRALTFRNDSEKSDLKP